ncbi:MAG TPA: biopolymer transporter ExbD [Pirellulales bacterium]|nr:biopolymer transporter ExbD [Pirellulales bacterium]
MAEVWRVRIEDDDGLGRAVRFERLAQGVQDGVWGPSDQVRAPQEADWALIGECEALEEYLPRQPLFRRVEGEEAEMDMTPMIDITFQLLIFFMIAATYVVQKTLDMPPLKTDEQAPATVTMAQLAEKNIIVRVSDDQSATVDGVSVPLNELTAALKKAVKQHPAGQPEIALDMADQITQDTVVKVIDAAGGAQIEKVHFITHTRARGGAAKQPPVAEEPSLPNLPGA